MTTLFDLLVVPFGISGLCALIAVLFPRRLRVARNAATSAPATTAVVGFLSLCAALGLTVLYAISLVLFITALLLPFAALAWIIFAALSAIGWAVIAEPIGHMLLRRREIYAAPMAAAAVGGFVLTFGIELLRLLPAVGWIGSVIGFVLGSAGLGALLLTRLGTRPYPERHAASESASAPEPLIL